MVAASSIPEMLFSGAAAYRQWVSPGEVRESSSRYFPYTERHVQALWFDDSLRPTNLKTARGEPVIVENPGRWNLEAGPDFSGAVLRIGREKRRVAGDAEIHIFSNDWKNHSHHADPRYEGVRFHITWFPGTPDESLFPPGTIHISLYDICLIDLESIDVTAYPYQEPRASKTFPMSGRGPEGSGCQMSLHPHVFPSIGNDPNHVIQCLENAGQERLRQKTQRMAWLISERGEAQALYEEIAAALGYKNNKTPFRNLAQSLPISSLAQYGDDWETVYAVLLGLSGLLPKQPGAKWSTESKNYFRSLWDCWWREEHKWEETALLTRADWSFSGLRPLNHPVRRLCALAQWIVSGFFDDAFATRLVSPKICEGGSAVPQRSCFWATHIGWTGTAKKAELVGKGRLQAIELNVLVPFRLAKGASSILENLPVEPMNSIIRETAYTLFGPDHSPKLYRSALARQGLIQIFNDFILAGRSLSDM
ncbi:MAG: DUF2851 family protein [Kiritimatiellales bacterium]|nr:DUF2851 family protein [Kiritimatiellota bacterium]MBL7011351.1 DUF2851 family protein [Kiritimatiellales bacterium]